MKKLILLLSVIIIVSCEEKPDPYPVKQKWEITGSVVQLDTALTQIVDTNTVAEIIAEGFEGAESPVWSGKYQFLLFSDVLANAIYRWDQTNGLAEYLRPSGYTDQEPRGGKLGSNGLIIDKEGNLVICQQGDRSVARMTAPVIGPKPEFEILAQTYNGKRLNGPNDLVQHSSGAIYFTDNPYGLEKQGDDLTKELPFQGVYRIDPSGELTLLTDELSRPNGIAFSPDEQTLYVSNSDPNRAIWMAYSVDDDGGITNGRIFHNATDSVGQASGLPDGMAVDSDGIIYATGPGGIWIFNPDGKILGKFNIDPVTSNCTMGNQGNMLYMTADSLLLRLSLK